MNWLNPFWCFARLDEDLPLRALLAPAVEVFAVSVLVGVGVAALDTRAGRPPYAAARSVGNAAVAGLLLGAVWPVTMVFVLVLSPICVFGAVCWGLWWTVSELAAVPLRRLTARQHEAGRPASRARTTPTGADGR
jgi:hypothetical protein